MKKRGQLLGQPFMMIFALIVGALILAWGAYEVYKLVNVAKDVQAADYISNLRSDVNRYYYYVPGSSNKFKVGLPASYDYICFVNHNSTLNPAPSVKPPNYNHVFVDARKSDDVFVYSKNDVLAYNVPYVRPPDGKNPLCLKNQKSFILTSKGNYVEVNDV